MYEFLDNSQWIGLVGIFTFPFLAMFAYLNKKKILGGIFLVFVALSVVVASISCEIEYRKVEYTAIIEVEPVEFVKEDRTSGRVVWGIDGEQFFRDIHDCEIVVIDESAFSKETPDVLKFPILPYFQWNRTETYFTAKIYDHVFQSKPTTKDIYRFYVPNSYLDDSEFDWQRLFGVKG
ncbi:hypothetical protein IKE19_02375 [Candidatus Saccharibacteria bacterium]|nr:hypothetical protein [Candidatus Saccharibacteria bacterium]